MDKKILRQYTNLIAERREIADKIEKIERELKTMRLLKETTKDSVKGGEGGIQHFVIEGYPTGVYQQKVNALKERRAKLIENDNKIAETVISVEEYIASIPDEECVIRRIINLFIIEGKSWSDVAKSIGGGNTADSVRKMYDRYIRK